MNDILNLMKELTEAFGPSGFEDDVIEIVRKRTEFIDNQKDSINNLYFGLEKLTAKTNCSFRLPYRRSWIYD